MEELLGRCKEFELLLTESGGSQLATLKGDSFKDWFHVVIEMITTGHS